MKVRSGQILVGDSRSILSSLPEKSVHCCVTSPPYWGLRDYLANGQIGLEASPHEYIDDIICVFSQVWRVLRDDGSLWLNLGDTYIGYHGNKNALEGAAPSDKPGYRENMRHSSIGLDGLKNKDLAGIPWRVAFALQESGWFLRSDIIWHKPNPMPESVKDRPTKAHEYIFLLTKSEKYFYNYHAIKEAAESCDKRRVRRNQPRLMKGLPKYQPNKPGKTYPVKQGTMGTPADGRRNRRTVWTVATRPYREGHFATFPPDLIRPCILAGCPVNGIVLDPFFGSGTVGQVCIEERRRFIGIELNPEYVDMAGRRLACARPKALEQCQLCGFGEHVA